MNEIKIVKALEEVLNPFPINQKPKEGSYIIRVVGPADKDFPILYAYNRNPRGVWQYHYFGGYHNLPSGHYKEDKYKVVYTSLYGKDGNQLKDELAGYKFFEELSQDPEWKVQVFKRETSVSKGCSINPIENQKLRLIQHESLTYPIVYNVAVRDITTKKTLNTQEVTLNQGQKEIEVTLNLKERGNYNVFATSVIKPTLDRNYCKTFYEYNPPAPRTQDQFDFVGPPAPEKQKSGTETKKSPTPRQLKIEKLITTIEAHIKKLKNGKSTSANPDKISSSILIGTEIMEELNKLKNK